MLLYGLVLFVDDNSHSKFLGLVLIFASYFFHRTMYITILFAGVALIKQNRKSVILLVMLYPFIVILATYVINAIVSGIGLGTIENLGSGDSKVEAFASAENAEATIFGIIQQIITYVPQYLALVYVTKRILFDKILNNDDKCMIWTYLMKFSFVCIYVASCFCFSGGSHWIFERFKYMGMIPLTFVLAKVWSVEPKTNLWVKSLIFLQSLSLSYRWFIQYYHWR